jgi:hypothetical protein
MAWADLFTAWHNMVDQAEQEVNSSSLSTPVAAQGDEE